MPGPLADLGTVLDGIVADIDRALWLEQRQPQSIRFVVPDTIQSSKWRTVLVVPTGWNRESANERTQDNASEVIFSVADINAVMPPVLALKDLHCIVEDEIYSVARTPPVANNEAHTYFLTCKVRTLRNVSDNKK